MVSSCQKDVVEVAQIENSSNQQLSYEQTEANRITFAKTFAEALNNNEVRNLIKSEAEKQFDQDTDVLFQMIKDKKIDHQTTLFDYLASIHGSKTEFEQITNSLPLLTILVPHLVNFSTDKWDTESQIPLVAVLPNNKTNGEKARLLPAFSSHGEEQALDKNVEPTVPVLVIKDNERIALKGKGSKNVRINNNDKVAFTNNTFSYVFLDESFDIRNKISHKNARVGNYSTFDQRVRFAYDNNLQYHRDYIYYGIAPELGVTTGALNINYAEFITAIRFADIYSFNNVYDDPSTDWSDGYFEFMINIYFVDGKTSLGTLSKGFSVGWTDLYTYTQNSNGTRTITGTKEYTIPGKGIIIETWNMQRYGDTWKFSIFEQDQQTVQTYSISSTITSNFGSNYTNNVKDGPNFGNTSSSGASYQQSYSIAIAGGTDQLYDGILKWTDKILTKKTELPSPVPGQTIYFGGSYHMNTGTIHLSVEPRYKY